MDLNGSSDNTIGTTLQQTDVNVQKSLTPEQEEELKLRAKYPNTQKPGGSKFVQKILTKGGHKKYFDSGDYNMAKSNNKNKLSTMQTTTLTPIPHNTSLTPSTPNSITDSNSSKNPDESLASQSSPVVSSPCVVNSHYSNYSNDLLSTDNLVSEDTLGHEIPKPEDLPSRKHSTVQSKLATAELSSSPSSSTIQL